MKIQSEISAGSAGTTNGDGRDLKKLEKAARDFESILIGQFFKLMHSTVGDEGAIEKSFPRKLYEEMMQDEFAREFSGQGGFNLQKVLVERYTSGKPAEVDANRHLPVVEDAKSLKRPEEGFRGQTAGFGPLRHRMNHGKISGKEYMQLQGDGAVAGDERKK